MKNKFTNRAKMSNKRCIKARLQYFTQRGYKASEVTSRATSFALRQRFSSLTCLILPSEFLSFVFLSFLFFVSEKNGLKMTVFAHSQTTNKLANEAAKDSARSQAWKKKMLFLLLIYVAFRLKDAQKGVCPILGKEVVTVLTNIHDHLIHLHSFWQVMAITAQRLYFFSSTNVVVNISLLFKLIKEEPIQAEINMMQSQLFGSQFK